MMDSNESSCVPPGFRFHPTDEELVGYYLRKKIAAQKIDLDVITDIDLYRIEPWDLQEKCGMGYEEQKEWYFFSHKDKKYPTGTRTNRATMAGFWKATGRDKAVYDHKSNSKLIGMRKTLVFYKGRAPNGHKTDWIMHEYRLQSQENTPPQEEGWVVCRAFKKKITGQAKSNIEEGWEPNYFYDEPIGVSSILPRQLSHQNFMSQNSLCKKEIEADNNNNNNNNNLIFLHSDQLPQLESPSSTLMKRPISSVSLVSETIIDAQIMKKRNINNSVTDWRALDKFVASQLSHDIHEEVRVSSYEEPHNDSDLGMLLLQSGRDQGPKLDDLLSSCCNRDIDICIFDK